METPSPTTLEWELPPSSSSDGEEEEEEEDGVSPPPPRPLALSSFDRDRHVAYLEMTYHMLPYHYQGQEINHLTLVYFTISGLQLLRAFDRVDKDAVVAWVLSFLAQPGDAADLNDGQFYGFNGSKSSQYPSDNDGLLIHNHSHLASTYSALAILKTVGYNLSNIDSKLMLRSLRNLQQPDGSFLPIHIGAETDLRFVYCAADPTLSHSRIPHSTASLHRSLPSPSPPFTSLSLAAPSLSRRSRSLSLAAHTHSRPNPLSQSQPTPHSSSVSRSPHSTAPRRRPRRSLSRSPVSFPLPRCSLSRSAATHTPQLLGVVPSLSARRSEENEDVVG